MTCADSTILEKDVVIFTGDEILTVLRECGKGGRLVRDETERPITTEHEAQSSAFRAQNGTYAQARFFSLYAILLFCSHTNIYTSLLAQCAKVQYLICVPVWRDRIFWISL